jgi:hypothetical protein
MRLSFARQDCGGIASEAALPTFGRVGMTSPARAGSGRDRLTDDRLPSAGAVPHVAAAAGTRPGDLPIGCGRATRKNKRQRRSRVRRFCRSLRHCARLSRRRMSSSARSAAKPSSSAKTDELATRSTSELLASSCDYRGSDSTDASCLTRKARTMSYPAGTVSGRHYLGSPGE